MKIYTHLWSLFFVSLMIFSGCQSNDSSKNELLSPLAHVVKVKEVLQASQYTYVMVDGEHSKYWLAIDKSLVNVGDTYYWSIGMIMENFTSKELNKTFDYILFVSDFSSKPITLNLNSKQNVQNDPHGSAGMSGGMKGNEIKSEKKKVEVTAIQGGITISDLYKDPSAFGGKKVKIRGQVVRYSGGIINRNWVHIQDGTEYGEFFDLTVTTKETLKIGDEVTFEGVISLKKDFGAGYLYDVIMEDAAVSDIQQQ